MQTVLIAISVDISIYWCIFLNVFANKSTFLLGPVSEPGARKLCPVGNPAMLTAETKQQLISSLEWILISLSRQMLMPLELHHSNKNFKRRFWSRRQCHHNNQQLSKISNHSWMGVAWLKSFSLRKSFLIKLSICVCVCVCVCVCLHPNICVERTRNNE